MTPILPQDIAYERFDDDTESCIYLWLEVPANVTCKLTLEHTNGTTNGIYVVVQDNPMLTIRYIDANFAKNTTIYITAVASFDPN